MLQPHNYFPIYSLLTLKDNNNAHKNIGQIKGTQTHKNAEMDKEIEVKRGFSMKILREENGGVKGEIQVEVEKEDQRFQE